MCEHKAARILLFSNCAQQARREKTGPLRSSSSVPTALMSVSILSGKPYSKSTALFTRVTPLRADADFLSHIQYKQTEWEMTNEWNEAMAICLV